mmetsp:Transcript_7241/g.18593  ORF Transcript_7241/g.18593 Transcript_7241/m.18593 type:complete len:366 (+) Transcript_7241:897-1994(+)
MRQPRQRHLPCRRWHQHRPLPYFQRRHLLQDPQPRRRRLHPHGQPTLRHSHHQCIQQHSLRFTPQQSRHYGQQHYRRLHQHIVQPQIPQHSPRLNHQQCQLQYHPPRHLLHPPLSRRAHVQQRLQLPIRLCNQRPNRQSFQQVLPVAYLVCLQPQHRHLYPRRPPLPRPLGSPQRHHRRHRQCSPPHIQHLFHLTLRQLPPQQAPQPLPRDCPRRHPQLCPRQPRRQHQHISRRRNHLLRQLLALPSCQRYTHRPSQPWGPLVPLRKVRRRRQVNPLRSNQPQCQRPVRRSVRLPFPRRPQRRHRHKFRRLLQRQRHLGRPQLSRRRSRQLSRQRFQRPIHQLHRLQRRQRAQRSACRSSTPFTL